MSYEGKVRTLRAAQGGAFATLNPDSIPAIYVQRLKNITLENDLWETEPGTEALNGTAITGAPTIGTIVDYSPGELIQRLIACGRDGTIWKSDNAGASYSLLKSGLAANALLVPVEGGAEETGRPKKLFLLGGGLPQVLTGDPTTAAAVSTPSAPAAEVLEQSGAITPGQHGYRVTVVTAIGETAPSQPVSALIENATRAQVRLTAIPLGPSGTVSRRIYRTKADASDYLLLATLADNTTQEYTDNTADGSLGSLRAPTYDSTAPVHRISRPHADWATGSQPTSGFLLEGRLAVLLEHYVYVSARSDHEDFLTAPLVFPVFTGKGDRLVGGVYWRQQGWLWKQPRGIYRIDTSDINTSAWQVHEHSQAAGLAGPLALAVVKGSDSNQFFDDVVFVDPSGSFNRLSKVQANQEGDVNASSISEETFGQFIREQVNRTRLAYAQVVYIPELEEVQAAVSLIGSAVNNARIKANLKRLREYGIRFHHAEFPECEALALMRGVDGVTRLIAGASGGFLKRLYSPTYSDAGAGAAPASSYESEVWTYDDDFGELGEEHRLNTKNYHALVVEGLGCGDWNLPVDVYVDGLHRETLQVSMKPTASFILDQSRLDQDRLRGVAPIRVTKRLHGRGYRISYRCRMNTAGRYFKLTRLQTLYALGGLVGAAR